MTTIFKKIIAFRWAILLSILGPLFANVPLLFFNNTVVSNTVKAVSPDAHNLLSMHPFAAIFIATGLGIALTLSSYIPINTFLDAKKSPLTSDELLTYQEIIEQPVQEKMDRVCELAKNIAGHTQENKGAALGAYLFMETEKPETQIQCIANSIHTYFKSLDHQSTKIKVLIFYVKDNIALEKPLAKAPKKHPNTPIDKLNEPGTPLSKAIKTKKMIVMPDTSKATSGAVFYQESEKAGSGSLICYPIVIPHHREVRMVVCVHTPDSPGYFKNNKEAKKAYSYLFDKIANRLILEHSLYRMQEKVRQHMEGQDDAAARQDQAV